MAAPCNNCMRKIPEASFVAHSRSSLNEQIDSKKLLLYFETVLHYIPYF